MPARIVPLQNASDGGLSNALPRGARARPHRDWPKNVWVNDPRFHELENERDPIIGAPDGSYDLTIPKRPIKKKMKGLPAFTTVKGGTYFFLPGIRALRFLAEGGK